MFDNNNIINSIKTSYINAKDMILKDEKDISENRELKKSFTFKIIIVAICLLIYWIILMLIYEKDKKYILDSVNDEELFNKYNPMIAGCIQGSRQILARDIIAIILNLINKKAINLEIVPAVSEQTPYRYIISRNDEKYNEIDWIEQYIYDWVFDTKNKVDLKQRLEEMPKEKKANEHFKKLNKAVEEELAKKGANEAKVPLIIRAFNIFLFILSIVLVFKHITFNGFDIFNPVQMVTTFTTILAYSLPFIPVIMGLIQVILNIIIMIRHKVNKTVQKVTGQKVATTTISTVIFFGIIIILTAIFAPAKFLVADEILICIATILVLTDNLMLKNDAIMIEDYSKLNTLKKKIEDYTLLSERNIEYIELWDKYLSYAVSFGISNKVINCMQGLNIDDDLEKLVSSDFMNTYLTTNYYYFYNNASLDKIFMKRYGELSSSVLSNWDISTGSGSSSGGGGGFSGGGSSSSGGGGCGGGRRSVLKYLFKELDKK